MLRSGLPEASPKAVRRVGLVRVPEAGPKAVPEVGLKAVLKASPKAVLKAVPKAGPKAAWALLGTGAEKGPHRPPAQLWNCPQGT